MKVLSAACNTVISALDVVDEGMCAAKYAASSAKYGALVVKMEMYKSVYETIVAGLKAEGIDNPNQQEVEAFAQRKL